MPLHICQTDPCDAARLVEKRMWWLVNLGAFHPSQPASMALLFKSFAFLFAKRPSLVCSHTEIHADMDHNQTFPGATPTPSFEVALDLISKVYIPANFLGPNSCSSAPRCWDPTWQTTSGRSNERMLVLKEMNPLTAQESEGQCRGHREENNEKN